MFITDFNKSLQYQISRKSALWEPRWYMRTDVQTRPSPNALLAN